MADTTTFQAKAYTARGTDRGETVTLPESTFDGTVNMPVMHQAVKAFLANQRQANASTKTRRYVVGGNQKPWKQKGTGRARQGSTRAPHWVGGGTVFGPSSDRNYEQKVPKQIRQLAKKSALNARAQDGDLLVIDAFQYDAPRTRRIAALVASLGLAGKKVLILTDGLKPAVFLSARNHPTVHVMPFSDSSTYHILWSDVVLVESGAIGQSLEPRVEAEPAETPKAAKPAARKAAPKKTASSEEGGKKPAAKKAAAKKSAKASDDAPAAKKAAAKKTAAKKSAKEE